MELLMEESMHVHREIFRESTSALVEPHAELGGQRGA
jgi:hypothetical protein